MSTNMRIKIAEIRLRIAHWILPPFARESFVMGMTLNAGITAASERFAAELTGDIARADQAEALCAELGFSFEEQAQ